MSLFLEDINDIETLKRGATLMPGMKRLGFMMPFWRIQTFWILR